MLCSGSTDPGVVGHCWLGLQRLHGWRDKSGTSRGSFATRMASDASVTPRQPTGVSKHAWYGAPCSTARFLGAAPAARGAESPPVFPTNTSKLPSRASGPGSYLCSAATSCRPGQGPRRRPSGGGRPRAAARPTWGGWPQGVHPPRRMDGWRDGCSQPPVPSHGPPAGPL